MAGVRYLPILSVLSALQLISLPAGAAAVDAQAACVAPVQSFAETLENTAADQARKQFLGLVRACRAVYAQELRQVEHRYGQLPESSDCREMSEEFREASQTLARIERTAAQLPLASEADQEAALAFYRLAAPGLSRAVKGLFILHYGVCKEEARAGFQPAPSSHATISTPIEAAGRL